MTAQLLVWGSALAGLVALGLLWRAVRQGLLRRDDPAFGAWRDFDNRRHLGINRLVSAAILAASPHNSQPWRLSLHKDRIDLWADFGRKLGAMDPFEREMFIGLGCALENMAVAAPGAGFAADIALLPDARSGLAATVSLKRAAAAPHRLERAIGERRTDRGRYDTARPIAPAILRALKDEAGGGPFELFFLARGSAEAQSFADLTLQATRDIVSDRKMSKDSARWYRHSQTVTDAERDGLTMDTFGLAPWFAAVARLMPRPSEKTAHIYWLANTRDIQLATAAQIGIFAVPPDRFLDDTVSLSLGRAWQRLHLAATQARLAGQPLNQIPERIARERQLARAPGMQRAVAQRLALDGKIPAFCFRLGYPTREAPHAPRRDVDAVTGL
jgi:nitroreductase